jgi:hypothetical protein
VNKGTCSTHFQFWSSDDYMLSDLYGYSHLGQAVSVLDALGILQLLIYVMGRTRMSNYVTGGSEQAQLI